MLKSLTKNAYVAIYKDCILDKSGPIYNKKAAL
jgi:hypothetical protein